MKTMEKEEKKDYSDCLKKCLDESSNWKGENKLKNLKKGVYRIKVSTWVSHLYWHWNFQPGQDGDLEAKMACVIMCFYDKKLEPEKKKMDKKEIDEILM